MKKEKTDYFKELENFSLHCMLETEKFNSIINHSDKINPSFDSIDELKKLTERLKKEYFTPIEREDIFILASSLSDLCLSIQKLNSFSEQNSFYPTEAVTLSNFLYSVTTKINEAVINLSTFPKSDVYSLFFEIKKLTEKAIKSSQNDLQSKSNELNRQIIDCIKQCNIFSDRIIYIYLKNT